MCAAVRDKEQSFNFYASLLIPLDRDATSNVFVCLSAGLRKNYRANFHETW